MDRQVTETTTLGELIHWYEKDHPDARIDSAVPQQWWDENRDEIKRRGGAVWLYDDNHRIFGTPMFIDTLIKETGYK